MWHLVFPWISHGKSREVVPCWMSEEIHFLEADCNMLRHVGKKLTDASERL